MMIGKWNEADRIMVDGREVVSVDDFCYFGSLKTTESSSDKEVRDTHKVGKCYFWEALKEMGINDAVRRLRFVL